MNYFKLSVVSALSVISFQLGLVQAQPVAEGGQPGSFLVFPKFDIRGTTTTQVRITNIADVGVGNPVSDLKVKLNYVCPGVKDVDQRCRALDRTITLTPHQTRVINVSAHNPPCKQGFLVAWAVNPVATATPISWNYLLGSYNITTARISEAENAISIQALPSSGTPLSGLNFNGADYRQLGTELFTDFTGKDVPTGSGSFLTLLSLDTLAGRQNPPTLVYIDFWNQFEVPFSSSLEYVCWVEVPLEEIDPNFVQSNLETCNGSITIMPAPNCPVPGGCPPLNAYDPVVLGAITEYYPGSLNGRTLLGDGFPKSTSYSPR